MEVGQGLLEVPTAFQGGSCKACCAGNVAVEPWLLKRQVTGMGRIGFCTRNVLHHGLHLQQKLLSCLQGTVRSWASEEQQQLVLSHAVRSPPISRAISAPHKLSTSEDREFGSCRSPKVARHGACSSPSSPFEVAAAVGKPVRVPPATTFGKALNGLGFRAGAPKRASTDPDHSFCSLGEGRGSVATVASTCTMSSGAWKGCTRIWGLPCPHDHSPALFFPFCPHVLGFSGITLRK